MKAKNISKKIAEATLGVLTTAVDLVLFTFFILEETALNPVDTYSMTRFQKGLGRLFQEGKDRIVRNAINNAIYKEEWLKRDRRLTEEGKKRLRSAFPQFLPKKQWDGNWFLVIFDIPEKMRIKRDILRENLRALGFGRLQASVWISSVNYLENIEKIIKGYGIEPYVIFLQTNKLGKETSRFLAEKIWQLSKINREYENFVLEWKNAKKSKRFWLYFLYLSILKNDPQLPKELLPEEWLGETAHNLVKNKLDKLKVFFK